MEKIDEKIRLLSKGRTGKNLIDVLEDIKQKVADIRTPLKIKAEIANEVRLGIIEALDLFLVEKLKVLSGELEAPDPNEHV